MKLTEILKGSEYSLGLFKQQYINDLEKSITGKIS